MARQRFGWRVMKNHGAICAAALGAMTALSGCTADEDEAAREPAVPSVEEAPPGITEIPTGGETTCSRGTDYAFFVRRGTVNKLVIDFHGGGACWTESTCSIADAIFSDSVQYARDELAAGNLGGIYDTTNPENPFKDWWHVSIPYCTGDVHTGNATVVYGEGEDAFTIEHKGAVNARTVLDWIFARFERPETVLVTGCSAGSYGSIFWAPYVMEHYADSRVLQFGDSGVGVITDEFFRESFPGWNSLEMFPTWVPELNPEGVDILALSLSDYYRRAAAFYGDRRFSQYTTAFDENQAFYYSAMGGDDGAAGWSERMYALVDSAHEGTPNFYSYVAPGELHCILPFNELYEVESGGVRLVDWLGDLVGEAEPARIRCTDCEP